MMKNFNELTAEEKAHYTNLFSNWLKNYTHAVIVKVMDRADEILNTPTAIDLLTELYLRESKEQEHFNTSIEMMLTDLATFEDRDPHSHPLTHSDSYRDVLYDLYIK